MNNGNRDNKRKIGLKRELVRAMSESDLLRVGGGVGGSNNTCPAPEICRQF